MNRVILFGRLADRPGTAYTPCGIAVTRLRLQVPRHAPRDGKEEVVDAIDCFGFRGTVGPLSLWGGAGLRVNLEGRLLPGLFLDENQAPLLGYHVWVERAYAVDPLPDPPVLHVTSRPEAPEQGADRREAA